MWSNFVAGEYFLSFEECVCFHGRHQRFKVLCPDIVDSRLRTRSVARWVVLTEHEKLYCLYRPSRESKYSKLMRF